jgi:hypothetical protein
MQPTRTARFDTAFLEEIAYVQASFQFRAAGAVSTPPFGGSTLRGVFGRAFRRHLCATGACDEVCQRPAECRYYSLFERERETPGAGPSFPKPYVLDPPVPDQLERIAAGASPQAPFAVDRAGSRLPVLRSQAPLHFADGAAVAVGMTLFGAVMPVLPAVIDLLARTPLAIGRGALVLSRVVDPANGLPLWDREMAHLPAQAPRPRRLPGMWTPCGGAPVRLQVSFLTPVRLRVGEGYCFDPERLAAHFWEAALSRAVRVRDFLCRASGARLPFVELPARLPRMTGCGLYRYALRRLSHRQGKFMDFDGVVGSLFYEGELAPLLPLACATEVLHVGQKATFGLGRVQCRVWEGSD